jgi:hypothetical protein
MFSDVSFERAVALLTFCLFGEKSAATGDVPWDITCDNP